MGKAGAGGARGQGQRPEGGAFAPSGSLEVAGPPAAAAERKAALRLREAYRDGVTPVPAYLDRLLPADHLARLLWAAVERLDLSAFYEGLVVVEGGPGRAAADPKLLVALWLYATCQGVTLARELDRLCVEKLDFLWLCGGVTMNYHSLSDFRVRHQAALDELMTDVLGRLRFAGLVEFRRVAQDGLRVRASAGAASFRRRPTLEQALAEARQFLAALAEAEERAGGDDGPADRRKQAAQERAARERVGRLEAALAAMPAAEAAKDKKDRDKARVSTTDAEARVMKMPDGGFRPAYNFQFVADTREQVIVGVEVSANGSDRNQALPMAEQVEARCGDLPPEWLMDGGFPCHETIDTLADHGVRVFAPIQAFKDPERDPHAPQPGESGPVTEWRARMGSEAAKQTYRLRAQTIECVNAQARCRHGLQQLPVRGLQKVRCVALWVAIAHNLLIALREGVFESGFAAA
jgi:transposase